METVNASEVKEHIRGIEEFFAAKDICSASTNNDFDFAHSNWRYKNTEFAVKNGSIGRNGDEVVFLEKSDSLALIRIETPPGERKRGDARHMLESVCEFADQLKLDLYLEARPKPGCNYSTMDLVDFYARLGFDEAPGLTRNDGQDPIIMKRSPSRR
jgi:GNAT superfamily N-acetyltransferase